MTVIVSGFPGVGKSTLFKLGLNCCDSDSSQFDKSQFPQNYIKHIKDRLSEGKLDYIFVSSHEAVRLALHAEGIPFMLVYPHIASKQEYMAKYVNRGSPRAFLDLMDAKWSEFILSCSQDLAKRIVLKPYQTLSDVLPKVA